MKNDFKIRKATEQDIDCIMQIEEKGFIREIRESRKVFLERIKNCPDTFLIFESESEKCGGKFCGNCGNKDIFGYLSAEFLPEIPDCSEKVALNHTPNCITNQENQPFPVLYISSFSLLPNYRGNGNGKKCWNLAMEYFEKIYPSETEFCLLVNEQWIAAKKIYISNGFVEKKVFKNFFPCSENGNFANGILMVK